MYQITEYGLAALEIQDDVSDLSPMEVGKMIRKRAEESAE